MFKSPVGNKNFNKPNSNSRQQIEREDYQVFSHRLDREIFFTTRILSESPG